MEKQISAGLRVTDKTQVLSVFGASSANRYLVGRFINRRQKP